MDAAVIRMPEKIAEMDGNKTYQGSLSLAGEQRDYVEEVARHVLAKSIAAFYDGFETVSLWGKDGTEALHEAFAKCSTYVVMFISVLTMRRPRLATNGGRP